MVPKRKKIAMYAAMIIITAIVVFPFLWMVLLSFKSSSEIMSNPLAMPKAFNLDNFKHALETLNFPLDFSICSKFDFIQYASSDSIFETASYGN